MTIPDSTTVLFRGASVLTMDPAVGDLEHGDVLVADGLITAVGEHFDAPAGATVVDATKHILLPGFVDTHRHMYQAVVRGIAPAHTLETYFADVLFKVSQRLDPEDVYTGTKLSALGALDAGVTSVQDISNLQDTPEHADAAIAALRESGIRARFAYCNSLPYMQRAGAALPPDVTRLRREVLDDDSARVTMAVVSEWLGDEEADKVNFALATDLDLPIARHIAPNTPLQRLVDLGVIRPGTVFIHGNGLTRHDLQLIVDTGSTLSVSPTVEQIMGFGDPVLATAPEDLLLSLSIDVEVTVPGDFISHMRTAYEVARAQQLGPAETDRAFTVRDIVRMATVDGARALGIEDRTGSIEVGKQADLVLIRADGPGTAPLSDPYTTVVLQADRSDIELVVAGGQIVKHDGRLLADRSELLAHAAATSRRLTDLGALPL